MSDKKYVSSKEYKALQMGGYFNMIRSYTKEELKKEIYGLVTTLVKSDKIKHSFEFKEIFGMDFKGKKIEVSKDDKNIKVILDNKNVNNRKKLILLLEGLMSNYGFLEI